MLEVETLLSEAKEAPPCGPNLEHELAFFELEEAARGKAEQRVGDVVKPAEDPKWPKVVELAEGLLLRSKDLRAAVHLTRGLTRTEGMRGLGTGLGVIHGLLDRYWDGVHPQLEADHGDDATERVNALAPLADPETVLRDVRDTYLVNSREHGQLQVREVEVALGRLTPAATGEPSAVKALAQIHGQIAGAFAADRTVPAAIRIAHEHAQAIQTIVADRASSAYAIDLKPLTQSLETLLEACEGALGPSEAAAPGVASARTGAPGGVQLARGGEIQTREEAVQLLDLVCAYLQRHEPTNPAPLFIRRAQRLMTKSFVEIVKDLMPDSLSQLEKLTGEAEDKS
ncbi:MAG TPA: type VI secretion system protein TssA [Methylomirabilota bacterium]|jgi:type VI secretion system protein ImpA